MSDSPRKGSLLVIFLTVFIDLLGFGMVMPLLPVYGKLFAGAGERGASGIGLGAEIGLLMASFSAMQFLVAPIWGRISDRIGRRPVIMIGLAGSVVFYTIFGVATVRRSIFWLFVSRIGAGIAGATISTAHAYIADTTTLQTRAKGMALVGAAFGMGFTFGPLFAYLALLGGETDFGPEPGYAAAGLSAVALLLAYFKLPESLDPRRAPSEKKWFNFRSLGDALATPSVGLLLLITFLSVFCFANFESILSVFLRDQLGEFRFENREICLAFAYIGFISTVVQGGVVRRLATRISEGVMAAGGALVEVGGFAMMAQAGRSGSLTMLWVALGVIVTGFAFMTPSLNSLISRRSDPAKQGGILGVAQSASSLARILGPMAGLSLFHADLPDSASWPLWSAAGLMVLTMAAVLLAARSGADYEAENS